MSKKKKTLVVGRENLWRQFSVQVALAADEDLSVLANRLTDALAPVLAGAVSENIALHSLSFYHDDKTGFGVIGFGLKSESEEPPARLDVTGLLDPQGRPVAVASVEPETAQIDEAVEGAQ